MASNLTARQEIVKDTMIRCLADWVATKAVAGDHETWVRHVRQQAPAWKAFGNVLADEILGKEG